MSLDFGLVTMAVGGLTGRRATAVGVGGAVAAASHLINPLAAVVSWLHSLKYLSLFYWSVGDNQITRGVTVADYAVLIAAGFCALQATLIAFRGLDLR